MPVISYINSCLEKQNTDNSLIRHFVTEVSEAVSASLFNKMFDKVRWSTLVTTIVFFHCASEIKFDDFGRCISNFPYDGQCWLE